MANEWMGPQDIGRMQNSHDSMELLQAADVAHANAQRVEGVRFGAALTLSLGALVAAIVPGLAVAMSVLGVVGAALQLALGQISKYQTLLATKIQEKFDSQLFGIPPSVNSLPLPAPEEIGFLAKKFSGGGKVSWYVDVSKLPWPYAVLLCQRENLMWDWPLRRVWANRLLVASVCWGVLGIVIAIIADWSTRDLFLRWLAPSLPIYVWATTTIFSNRQVARDKQQLALEVDEKLGVLPAVGYNEFLDPEVADELRAVCIQYQSRIFHLRNHAERVPGRIYRKRRRADEELARTAAAKLRSRLLDGGRASG